MTRLARNTRIFPLAGSGEDVLPGESVEIKVLVADEGGPVEGAIVAFARGDRGSGTIDQVTDANANGVASCRWTPDATTPTQDLTATLTDLPPRPGVLHMPHVTRFVANLNLASDMAYSPAENCPEMDGLRTVQEAIDRLASLLPRLSHVSGDGLEAPVGATIELRAGIANRCGVGDPQVRFERLRAEGRRRRVWDELTSVGPDTHGIATCPYDVTDEPRQFLRALLLAAGEPVGEPVYFTVSPTVTEAERIVPAARVEIWDGSQLAENLQRTLVLFGDVAQFDTDQLYDPASDLTSLRATRPGTYIATGEIAWDQTSGTGYRSATIMLSGESVGQSGGPPLPLGVYTTQQVTAIVRMDAGDQVQLGATQGSGGRLLIFSSTLSLAWLGP